VVEGRSGKARRRTLVPDGPPHVDLGPDPAWIATRQEFARDLTAVREHAGLTVRDLARAVDVPASTLGGYFGGRHLPPVRLLVRILNACGVTEQAAIDQWLRAVNRVRRAPGKRPANAPVPYRGLASFQPEDADWFYGREKLTHTLVERLADRYAAPGGPFLVVGPSGSGKSSLLGAGLIPALRNGELGIPGSESWPLAWFTPGAHPAGELARQLDAVAGAGDSAAALSGTPGRLMVVVDQFEETFTSCRDDDERRAFIATLCAAGGAVPDGAPGGDGSGPRRPPALVVLGLRADFYPQALSYPGLARAAEDAQVVVGPMTEEGLRRAIVEPASKARIDLEEGLVELLLRDLAPPAGHPAPGTAHDAGALPLLSHALLATWQRRRGGQLTVAAYRDSGGIHGAVARTADAVYDSLTEAQRDLARDLFIRLTHVSDDGADTRRRVGRAELVDDPSDARSAELELVLDRFVSQRLITADTDTVEISHEALLHAWPRLRGWINADRAGLRIGHQLTDAAEQWRREQRDPAALYRGARLATARDWVAAGHRRELTSLALSFLDASVRRERRRIARLYQTIACLMALLLLAVFGGVIASQQRGQALEQRAVATRERNLAISRMVATRADRIRDKDVSLAGQLSLAAYRIAPTPEARSSLLDSSAAFPVTRMLGSDGVMQSVAFSPDGRTLAAGGADKTVRVWDVSDPKRPVPLPPPLTGPQDVVYSVAFSPDGRTLAAGGGDKTVRLWDMTDPRQPVPLRRPLTGPTALVYSLAFSPNGRVLAAGSGDSTVRLWDVANPRQPVPLPRPLQGARSYVQSVAFSPDGGTLAAGSDDQTVLLWDVRDPRRPRRLGAPLTGPRERVYSVAFSPDGRTLAAGSADKAVYRWSVADPGRPVALGRPLTGPTSWVNAVAFSRDGSLLAAGSSDGSARLWDPRTGRVTATLPHPGPVTAVAFRPGDHMVATSAADGQVRLWSLPGPMLTSPTDTVSAVAFRPDGRMLAIGSADLQLWSLAERRQVGRPLTNPTGFSGTAAFTRDGRTLAVGDHDGRVQLWDVADPGRAAPLGLPLRVHKLLVESLAFSPDQRVLATGSDDQTVRLWNVTDRARPVAMTTLTGFASYVYSVAWSPDGRTLAAGSIDRTVRLWDVGDPRQPVPLGKPLTGPTNYVLAVAFSPDGRTLAVGSADRTVRLWDVGDPRHPAPLGKPLTGPTSYVYSLAFSPGGDTLAAANTDHTVWLWDLHDRRLPAVLATLSAATGAVYSVAFNRDGHTLAAGGADQIVWLWNTDPEQVATNICAGAGDDITDAEWRQYVPGWRYQPPCRAGH
jgi:WD40 repeat protein/transcriptional regulator with XRE-family HTH domain